MSARGFGDFDVDLPFDSGDVVVVWVQVRMQLVSPRHFQRIGKRQ